MADHETIAILHRQLFEEDRKRVAVWAFNTLHALYALGLGDGHIVPPEAFTILRDLASRDATHWHMIALNAIEAATYFAPAPALREDDWPTPEQVRAAGKPREV